MGLSGTGCLTYGLLSDCGGRAAETILAVEAVPSEIHWIEPRDLDVEALVAPSYPDSRPRVDSKHPGGNHVLFADGSVRPLPADTSPQTLRAMARLTGP